jgi:hypothetical protein
MDQLGYTTSKSFGLIGWAINVSTMPVAYAAMAVATTLQGITDFVQNPLGTISKIGGQFSEAISTIGGFFGDALGAISGLFGGKQSSGNSGRGENGSGSGNQGIGGFSGADLGKGSESW